MWFSTKVPFRSPHTDTCSKMFPGQASTSRRWWSRHHMNKPLLWVLLGSVVWSSRCRRHSVRYDQTRFSLQWSDGCLKRTTCLPPEDCRPYWFQDQEDMRMITSIGGLPEIFLFLCGVVLHVYLLQSWSRKSLHVVQREMEACCRSGSLNAKAVFQAIMVPPLLLWEKVRPQTSRRGSLTTKTTLNTLWSLWLLW